jgi:hypothetical protein
MSQYVIDIKDEKQAASLLEYLRTLSFLEIKTAMSEEKSSAIERAKAMLKRLPDVPYTQDEVNQAINDSIRKP